ncbi:MAG: hypothetical protein JW928_00975 [Candidatus Aureabacteria bacterium]|nr:hypothetical protein [Candidatus Auribacterota bacterium]
MVDAQQLEMIMSSPYVDDEFRDRFSSRDISLHRIMEHIMTGGVRPENEKGFVSFAADVLGVKAVDLDEQKIQESLIDVFPFKIAYAYRSAPLSFEEGVLEIACLDPLDGEITEDIQILTGFRLKTYLCGKYSLERYMERLYRKTWADVPHKDLDEEINVYEAVPDVLSVFLDVLADAVKKGAETIFFQPCQTQLKISLSVDGCEMPAYVPPVLEARYTDLVFLLRSKKSRLKDLGLSSVFHFFIEKKAVATNLFITPTGRGDLIRLDILSNRFKRIPDFEVDMFSEEEKNCLDHFRTKESGLLFVAYPGHAVYPFFHALCDYLAEPFRRGVLLEEETLKKTICLFQVKVKKNELLSPGHVHRAVTSLSPDFLAVRAEVSSACIAECAELSYRAKIPVVIALPFLNTRDVLIFLSQNINEKNKIFFSLLKTIGVMEARAFRLVCPVCSQEKQMNPYEHDFFKDIKLDVFSVRVEKSCELCNHKGYTGQDFLAESLFLPDPEVLKETGFSKAFEENGKRFSMRGKAIQKILKRLTTIKEMERILL